MVIDQQHCFKKAGNPIFSFVKSVSLAIFNKMFGQRSRCELSFHQLECASFC
jgi:hypothetical protein